MRGFCTSHSRPFPSKIQCIRNAFLLVSKFRVLDNILTDLDEWKIDFEDFEVNLVALFPQCTCGRGDGRQVGLAKEHSLQYVVVLAGKPKTESF